MTYFLAIGLLTLQTAGLVGADIVIDVRADGAVVEASYRVATDADSVVFRVMRLPEQELRITELLADGVERSETLERLPGLSQIVLRPERNGRVLVSIRYEVAGAIARIPLLIPDPPTDPGVSDVRIRLRGIASDALLKDGFPRLTRAGEEVVAQPENLPSFVRLPPRRGTLSTNRVADGVVIALLVMASGYWVYDRRRRRRPGSDLTPNSEPGR